MCYSLVHRVCLSRGVVVFGEQSRRFGEVSDVVGGRKFSHDVGDQSGIMLLVVQVRESNLAKGAVDLFTARAVGCVVGLGHDDGCKDAIWDVDPVRVEMLDLSA